MGPKKKDWSWWFSLLCRWERAVLAFIWAIFTHVGGARRFLFSCGQILLSCGRDQANFILLWVAPGSFYSPVRGLCSHVGRTKCFLLMWVVSILMCVFFTLM